MPLPRRLASPLVALACAGALTGAVSGCGSTAAKTTTATTATTTPASSAPASTAPPSSAAQAAGTPLLASGAVPAVTGASDLSKEPTVAAGSGPAPSTPTGKDLVVGHGAVASATDTVRVQYVGALYTTGKVFDASWTDDGPISFSLDQVIPGFKDAIVGMAVGGRREVVIPPADGYADTAQNGIPAGSTLVFVIDLLGITPGQ